MIRAGAPDRTNLRPGCAEPAHQRARRGSRILPLANFGTWSETGATVNSGVISSFADDELTMVNSSGAVKAQPARSTAAATGSLSPGRAALSRSVRPGPVFGWTGWAGARRHRPTRPQGRGSVLTGQQWPERVGVVTDIRAAHWLLLIAGPAMV